MSDVTNLPILHKPNPSPRSHQPLHKRISARLARLEENRKKIPWNEKWPTEKTIRKYKHTLLVPKITITPPKPWYDGMHWITWSNRERSRTTRPESSVLDSILAPSFNSKVDFPIAVQKEVCSEKRKLGEGFPKFGELPTEIRLQIWETKMRQPRMIEAQYATGMGKPVLLGNYTNLSPLLSTCRESREVAKGMQEKYESLATKPVNNSWSNLRPGEDHIAAKLDFVPERDTIFLRSIDYQGNVPRLPVYEFSGIEKIQHLALCFPSSSLALRDEWKYDLASRFGNLKTLTYMLGSRDQSWVGGKEIVLRDLEEWFLDGRQREFWVDSWLLDISEVGKVMSGDCFDRRMRGKINKEGRTIWGRGRVKEWEGLNVRVVAWSKV